MILTIDVGFSLDQRVAVNELKKLEILLEGTCISCRVVVGWSCKQIQTREAGLAE